MPTPPMHKYAFPITTKEAYKFWASRHICNRVKAIISFSRTEDDALRNLRNNLPKEFNHNNHHFRRRAVNAYKHYINQPEMTRIEFTPLGVNWWECIPNTPVPPAHGRWVVWEDAVNWLDDEKWVEWIDDPAPFTEENTNDDDVRTGSEEAAD